MKGSNEFFSRGQKLYFLVKPMARGALQHERRRTFFYQSSQ